MTIGKIKRKVKAEKTKKIKFGCIPEVVNEIIEAIAMAEGKQKSEVCRNYKEMFQERVERIRRNNQELSDSQVHEEIAEEIS